MRRILLSATIAVAAVATSWGTEYVIDGLRYDCTGSGNNAKAALMPAKSADTPYSGEITVPATVTVESMNRTYNVTSVKKEVFAGTTVTSVSFPEGVTDLGINCFEGCRELVSVVLPTSAYTLPSSFFKDCTALVEVTIPDTFGSLAQGVFEGCTALKKVTLPAGTGYLLGANLFKGCIALEHVVIPSNYTILGVNVFQGCESLKWVEFQNPSPSASYVGTSFFDDAFLTSGIIYVPDDAVETYKAIPALAGATVLPVSQRSEDPQPEWISRGEATFIDPWIPSVFNVSHSSWKVEVEESANRPGYFRMKNPYLGGNCPHFVEGEANDVYINACDPAGVYIETQGLGFTPNSSAAPELFISSVAGRHQENNIQSLDKDKEEGNTGFYADGIIKIPAAATLWSFPPYTDDDFYPCRHDFELRFPDAIVYEIKAEVMCLDEYYLNLWKECLTPGESVPVKVEATNGIAAVKYGFLYGVEKPTPADLRDIASSAFTAVNGRNDIPVPRDYVGRVSLILCAIDAQGNVRDHTRVLFDVIDSEAYGPWRSLGNTQYEDVVMLSIYDAYTQPYAVEIEESESRPGLYRLKNVYSTKGYWTSGEGNLHHHEEEDHFLYVNAERPDAVYVLPSPVGMKGNDGSMLLTSPVAVNLSRGYTLDEIAAVAPQMLGKKTLDRIVIPDGMVYVSETRYNNGEYAPANVGMEMKINLPTQTGIKAVEAMEGDEALPMRYYTPQGIEIAKPVPGIPLIRVAGGVAAKVIL